MNRTALVCLLGGLIIGALLGWLLAPVADDAPVARDSDRAVVPAPDVPLAAKPPPEKKSPPNPIAPDNETAPDVAAWIAEVRAQAVRGDGVITGTVKLKDGSPLPGVEIRSAPVFPLADLPPDATLEQEVKAQALQRMNKQAGGSTDRTDAAGNFRLTGLDESCLHRVEAQLDGYEINQIGGRGAEHHATGKEAHFIAKVVVWVTADVRMPDGSAAEVAQITTNARRESTTA
jgi:hypothetical protein